MIAFPTHSDPIIVATRIQRVCLLRLWAPPIRVIGNARNATFRAFYKERKVTDRAVWNQSQKVKTFPTLNGRVFPIVIPTQRIQAVAYDVMQPQMLAAVTSWNNQVARAT